MSASTKTSRRLAGTKKSKPSSRRAPNTPASLRDAEKWLLPTYKRPPFVLTHGHGSYVFDDTGKKYLDFLGGIAVNALGHAHPRIVKTIRKEAARAIHFSNLFHNEFQGPLAKKLAAWSGLDHVFFSNSGTEAMDGALKLARLFGRTPEEGLSGTAKKHRILALENSFHGRTFGAISVTATEKYRQPFSPVVPGVEFVRFNDVRDLESKFDDSVCAILLETIQGEGGIHLVSPDFWNRARSLTAQSGALLIADEIQCGLGRTGRYFAYQKFSTLPDIALIAKPLAAGLPLGAILTNSAVAAKVSPGLHGSTFGGGPLVCATALEFLHIVDDAKLLQNVRSRGAELFSGISALSKKFPFISEVRGEGLMIGVELSIPGAPLVADAMQRGLLMNCTHDFTLRLLPPFIVTKAEVKQFLQILQAVFQAAASSAAIPAKGTREFHRAHAVAR